MYYYVFEQSHSNQDKKVHDKVKFHLEEFNIAGEVNHATPARSAEELTDMGLRKGVSTIIAVGSDAHINRVVDTIKTVERSGMWRDIVFGVIPTDPNSSVLERLRLSGIEEACEALKYRRFTTIDLCYIEGVRYVFSTAEMHFSTPTQVKIRADRWEAEQSITDLIIFSDLTLSFYSMNRDEGKISKYLKWVFGSKDNDKDYSIFRAKTMQINSDQVLPLFIENEAVTKTPFVAYKLPRALKLIVKRDRFISDKEKE